MQHLLPIGTVVIVGKKDMMFMITGYNQKNKNGEVYDFAGVQYPHGLNSKNQQLTFNENEIKSVLYLGYQDTLYDLMKLKIQAQAQQEENK